METVQKSDTNIGIGFSIQDDPFQSGREAAQMARSQMRDSTPQLVLALGPANPHFKDFIEGVRLVTGEEKMVGISSERVVTNELYAPGTCVVALIRSNESRISLADAPGHRDSPDAAVTRLISTFRQARGNLAQQFDHRGLLVLHHVDPPNGPLPLSVLSESGLEPWFAGVSPLAGGTHPLICRDQALADGLVAIEILSQSPWGLGFVRTEAFKSHPAAWNSAVAAALRDALQQMKECPPAFGFLFFNEPATGFLERDFAPVFAEAQRATNNCPLIGLICAESQFYLPERTTESGASSVAALLMPG